MSSSNNNFVVKNGLTVNGSVTINSTVVDVGAAQLKLAGSAGASGQVPTVNSTGGIQFADVVPSPAGSNTQVQFNDSGTTNASSGLVFDKVANNLTVSNTLLASLLSGPQTSGNSTVNSSANSTVHKIQDAASSVTINSTAASVGSNVVVNTSAVSSPSHLAGANVTVNASGLFVGNSTVNSFANSTVHKVQDSAAAVTQNSTSITIGSNVVVNTSAVSAPSLLSGANVVLNASSLFIGNSTVNAFVNSTSFLLNGASVGAQAADQALMEAASNTTTFVSPGNFKYHPGAVKAAISARITFNAVTGNISSVDTATDIITWSTTHGFTTGEQIITDGTNWPGPISNLQQVYFVNALSSTTFALYLTYDSAVADTSRVNLTSAGSGTRACKKLTLNESYSYGMRAFMPLYFAPAGTMANVQFVANWETPFSSNSYSVTYNFYNSAGVNYLSYITLATKNTSSYTSPSLFDGTSGYSFLSAAWSNTYVTVIAIGDQ